MSHTVASIRRARSLSSTLAIAALALRRQASSRLAGAAGCVGAH